MRQTLVSLGGRAYIVVDYDPFGMKTNSVLLIFLRFRSFFGTPALQRRKKAFGSSAN